MFLLANKYIIVHIHNTLRKIVILKSLPTFNLLMKVDHHIFEKNSFSLGIEEKLSMTSTNKKVYTSKS